MWTLWSRGHTSLSNKSLPGTTSSLWYELRMCSSAVVHSDAMYLKKNIFLQFRVTNGTMPLCDDGKQHSRARLVVLHELIAFPAVFACRSYESASFKYLRNVNSLPKLYQFRLLPHIVPCATSSCFCCSSHQILCARRAMLALCTCARGALLAFSRGHECARSFTCPQPRA